MRLLLNTGGVTATSKQLVYGLALGDIDGTAKDFKIDTNANTDWAVAIVTLEGVDQTNPTGLSNVTLDVATEGKRTADAAETIVHAQGALTNGYVVVTLFTELNATTVSGITYGGAAMSVIASYGVATNPKTWYYGLALGTSAAGNKNVAVTLGGADDWAYCITTWNGVHQTTSAYTHVSGTATSTSATLTLMASNRGVGLIAFAKDTDHTLVCTPSNYYGTSMGKILDQSDISGTAFDFMLHWFKADSAAIFAYTWGGANVEYIYHEIQLIPAGCYRVELTAQTSISQVTTNTRGNIGISTVTKGTDSTLVCATTGATATAVLDQSDANATAFDWMAQRIVGTGANVTHVYTWGGASIALTWSYFEVQPVQTTVEINTLYTNGQYLFICPEGQRPRYSAAITETPNVSNWTITGTNARAEDYAWMTTYGGFTFAGKENTPYVYRSSSATLSTLDGDPADVATEIAVGAGNEGTMQAMGFIDNLYATKSDGIWTLDTTNNIATPKLNYTSEKSSLNFRSAATDGTFFYYTVRNKLYRWTGSTITDITPDKLDDDFPYNVLGTFDNFVHYENWLFYSAETSETTKSCVIIAYDGVGHHKLIEPITDGDGSITMMVWDPIRSYLWFHVNKAASNTTYYIPFRENSHYPYANFPVTGTHQLVSPRIDGGFRRISKSTPFLWIEADECSKTCYIRIKYALDGGDWVTWEDIKQNGVQRIAFPGGSLTQEFNYLQIAFQFCTLDATTTPVLEGATLQVMLRPEVLYGYTFDIPASQAMVTGGFEELRTAAQIKKDLRASRNSKSPVLLRTPDGDDVWGYVSSISGRLVEVNEDSDDGVGTTKIEYVISISFVETLTMDDTDAEES
jgi:hypothetical protein